MNEPGVDQAHTDFRGLISARVDGALAPADETALTDHLAACSRCRQVQHDYAEQRRLLQSLPESIPPRDMWARTAAALDRELLREAQHSPRASGARSAGLDALTTPRSMPSVLLVSAASVTMATILLITQLGPTLRLPDSANGPQATPVSAGVALAFVGSDSKGLTLYRTRVDDGCPNTAECPGQDAVEARVTFPASFEPSTLSLAPRGDRLAIMGSDDQRTNVFAVLDVPPLDTGSGADDAPSRPRLPGPGASSSPLVVVTTSPSPSVTSAGSGSITTQVALSTILDGVLGVGAAPAWSSDGQALAFSAMPSDETTGPDIYVWRVGDSRAHAITDDHRSYFASWSGNTIVVSRADVSATGPVGTPVITTLSINLATREQRIVRGPELWLPQVDPTGQRAVGWHGQLEWDGQHVITVHGALYMVDWASLNPFGNGAPSAVPTTDAVDMSNGGNPMNAATPVPTEVAASGPPAAADTPAPARTDPPSPRAPIASEVPATGGDARLTPVEPSRDPLQHPVVDWRVMWSDDGALLAEWISDGNSDTWGRLSLLPVGSDGTFAGTPLLASTLAKRGFNLADNRIAWVAPANDSPFGELRLRVWGAAGVRDVRVKPLDSTGVVAAF